MMLGSIMRVDSAVQLPIICFRTAQVLSKSPVVLSSTYPLLQTVYNLPVVAPVYIPLLPRRRSNACQCT
eukprot:scaffold319305_cov22-Prasinocladus_malaysianus.AAC.1